MLLMGDFATFGAGQRQQLIDQTPCPVDAGGNLAQCVAERGRVRFAEGKLCLGLQTGQRGAHLVGGIRNKTLLGLDVALHPLKHFVEGFDQRLQFFRHAVGGDRREIGRLARLRWSGAGGSAAAGHATGRTRRG
jgi:hypothetical protein